MGLPSGSSENGSQYLSLLLGGWEGAQNSVMMALRAGFDCEGFPPQVLWQMVAHDVSMKRRLPAGLCVTWLVD